MKAANDNAAGGPSSPSSPSSSSPAGGEANVVSDSMQEDLREWICTSRSISTVVGRSYVQHVMTFLRAALNKLESRRKPVASCLFSVSSRNGRDDDDVEKGGRDQGVYIH
jgi:hypothetical protein